MTVIKENNAAVHDAAVPPFECFKNALLKVKLYSFRT